jgi:hypothetical protein
MFLWNTGMWPSVLYNYIRMFSIIFRRYWLSKFELFFIIQISISLSTEWKMRLRNPRGEIFLFQAIKIHMHGLL